MKKHVLLAGVAFLGALPAFSQSPITFNAKGLVIASDADLSASALSDGKFLRDNAIRDKVTTVKFPLTRDGKSVGSTVVPNSVLTNANALVVPSTGGTAFILETKIRPDDAVTEYKDVYAESPEGTKLYAVDVLNAAAPKVKFGVPVGKTPTAIDIYKNELIIATREPGKKLTFIETDGDGKPTRLVPLPVQLDSTQNITDVTFHPSGNFVAVTLAPSGDVALVKIIRDGGTNKLKNIETVGKPVKAGDTPSFGRFTADGKSYVVLDTKGTPGKASAEAELVTVAFATDGAGEHKVGAKTPVGVGAASFALSPDGALAVVPSAGKSASPWVDASAGEGAKLTLVKVAADGATSKVADYAVDGILPQSVAFDKDGSNLAVTIFEYFDYGTRQGGVEFYSVTKGDAPALKKQRGRISVERGAHTVRIIP